MTTERSDQYGREAFEGELPGPADEWGFESPFDVRAQSELDVSAGFSGGMSAREESDAEAFAPQVFSAEGTVALTV